ncbi:hypothetical protein BJ973_003008 [Actinoplanes tereljensis]|uniref:DUF916 domain-containing protein n=1 Tax=Paractinoplanes tereljensis TaxID=571912 RepID=A0A919TW98_9ACTN|nr:hypothetical protein [Actinoplanes tereljensis]GIF22687.1 hypothetical protein Ate02nite_54170 [Actinoplanes tereljensis]
MFATVLAVVAGTAVPAGAAPVVPHPTTSGSADFSVSTSAEPVSPGTDGVVRTQLTVANNGGHDLTVTLRSVSVHALDNGQAELTDDVDPVWSSGVTVTPSLKLAAHTYRSVPVAITVPSALLPDIYLLGFVAEAQPVRPADAVRIYHRIGALVTLQLAGARQRRLTVTVEHNGFITIGSTFDGAFDVTNVGEAAAMARTQVYLPRAGTLQTGDGMQLIPKGTHRHVEFSHRVRGFFLFSRPQAQVLYGNGTGTLQTVTADGDTLLVIPWLTLILLGIVAAVLTAYLIWLRRRARRPGRHRATHQAKPAWAG